MSARRTILSIVALALLAAAAGPALAQLDPKTLPEPAPLAFKPPKPVEFTLGNGLRVLYLEDRDLPLVDVMGTFKCGSLYEPAAKAGLASLTGTVLRTGGTKTMTGDAIDEELEFLAATIECSIGPEFASVSAQCLKKDLGRVLALYADIIMNPEFREDRIDLARNQAVEAIRRRWDTPIQAARTLFTEKAYGADHPLGRRATPATLAAVTRQDLFDFHGKYFAPNNFLIGVTGDLSAAEAKDLLRMAFGAWRKKGVTFPAVPVLSEKADGTIFYAYKDTPQANMYLGHLGSRRLNPDEPALEIMNYILGGGTFSARLMKELRSNRGLTYGIYGGVEAGPDRGLFMISSQLKAERFVEALGLIKGQIKDLQERPVGDAELAEARNSAVNSFAFRFETKRAALLQYLDLRLEGYPANYLEKYVDLIRNVTKADVQAAAKKYMDPEKMIVLVVGDEKRFDKPLASFGKVEPIDLEAVVAKERAPLK
jgi:zinc protease